jgi:predicted molibdopterin-dependent oxidoreductase YjgC
MIHNTSQNHLPIRLGMLCQSICWAMGITQQDIGSDSSTAISNLLLVTGNYRNK